MFLAFKSNKYFIIPYLILLIVVFPFFILYNKTTIHLFLNQYHTCFFDFFFRYITYLGDGITVIIIVMAFVFISFKHSLFFLLSYGTGGIVAQILKRLVFTDFERPVKFFENIADLYIINGIDLHSYNSMPSGHTVTAFSLFLCFSMIVKNNIIKFTFFISACIIAYSRVYISQHFLIDIFVGSVIGVIIPLLLYKSVYCSEKKWLNTSITELFKK